ncbi:GNAT family N-acetyltransferase [Chryseobacterium sp. RP-3-3]|uniref:GNAT family N-acetyltransferase n=1 Tax=Chryseobacterium antibioticum TaxID=2728847 RepID=A0A7Y0FQB2_9FLAO|nr:GNAT family N-acetyltransferase [Chryseobacterium antibioticum]NML68833.1 GNAT family N-acetyltransferase [Chryseobacterium antibioticum]
MNDTNNEVQIINYVPQYKEAFKALNEEWIKKFFTMEAGDYKLLDNPEEHIINKGGHIVFALLDNEAVGTCALVKISDEPLRFELSKMAVSPKAQGKKIGYLVGQALVNKARELKAESIFLETNSVLVPAIKLYEKLGFKHMPVSGSAYERCDTQMLLKFND